MAERKFQGIRGTLESAELSADYDAAQIFDKLRVGEKGVYFREGLRLRYIPYDYMDRAFIRVQETRSRMCCGQANFNYFRIVFVHGGKEFADWLSEKEKETDDALAAIAAHGVPTGYVKENPAEM